VTPQWRRWQRALSEPGLCLSRDHLRQDVRRRRRIEQTARNIGSDTAADAYLAFAGAGDDDHEELMIAIGRLVVLLDQRRLLEES
jgi:hypothetical protein